MIAPSSCSGQITTGMILVEVLEEHAFAEGGQVEGAIVVN